MNHKLKLNYKKLIDKMSIKYGNTHGIFMLHRGKNTNNIPKKILLLGRENRGHGNKLKNTKGYNKPIIGDLMWLKDKYSKSPFWRVIGKALYRRYDLKYDSEIFENIYWTNLYKISPVLKKPNTGKSRKIQKELCVEILKNEILLVKPDYIIAFTGDWVNSFKNSLGNKSIKQHNKSLNSYDCKLENHSFKLIALPHPQGKTEEPIIKFIYDNLN